MTILYMETQKIDDINPLTNALLPLILVWVLV
jgi:hypothetical protein